MPLSKYASLRQPVYDPPSSLQELRQRFQAASIPPSVRSVPSSSTTTSSKPNLPSTPSLDSIQFQPRQIPTFTASYFIPTNTLKQMESLLKATPKIDEKQLQQRAKTQTELYTNPQIETLRQQINAFKSLITQADKEMDTAYSESREQAIRSVQDVIREAIQAAEAQPGGIRSGVAVELSRRAQREASPLLRSLYTDYVNTRDQILSMLKSQQNEARNLLNAIQANRKNMTKTNYNLLRDQAIQQFRQAQQAQQRFLQAIAQIEAGARQSAAAYQQESAAAYNQFMQQMIEQQRQNLAAQNMNAWIQYLTGSHVRDRNDALRLLNENRSLIQDAVGVDGYEQLYKYINNLGANWINPNYVGSTASTGTSSTTSTNSRSSSSGGFLSKPVISSPSVSLPNILFPLFFGGK